MPSIATQNLIFKSAIPFPAVPLSAKSNYNLVPLTVKVRTVF